MSWKLTILYGEIARVEFYFEQELIAVDSESPYTTSWEPKFAGNHEFVAVAVDSTNNSTISPPVTIQATLPDDYTPETPIVDLVVSQFQGIRFYDQEQKVLDFFAYIENRGIDDLPVGQEIDVTISLSQDSIWGNEDDRQLGVINYSEGLGSSYSHEFMLNYTMP